MARSTKSRSHAASSAQSFYPSYDTYQTETDLVDTPHLSQEDVASYLADMTEELARLSEKRHFNLIAYFLRMAQTEAELLRRGGAFGGAFSE